jgi:hypothetical protein
MDLFSGNPDARIRFLIVSWDGGGNTPPALNLGARLARQGHQVRLLGWESMAPRAAAAGVEFATYPSVPPWPPELAFEDALEERLLPALAGPATRDDILTEANGFAPDVVVDCMMDAGLEAAHVLGLPCAVLVHSRTARSGMSGATRRRASRRPATSTRRVPCWRLCRRASTGPARCQPTPPTSARSPTPAPGSRSIRATPTCWPKRGDLAAGLPGRSVWARGGGLRGPGRGDRGQPVQRRPGGRGKAARRV